MDEDHLFNFRLLGSKQIAESRLENWLSYYTLMAEKHYKISYDYGMKEMERTHSRYKRDTDYFNSIHGGGSGAYVVDRHGNRHDEPAVLPYIPLIPDSYWK